MVRIMTGTLLTIAQGRIAPDTLPEILAARTRTRAGITAPAQGLTLHRVFYDSLSPL
jgi:tRNA pseudouridine38-40 synthase